MPEEEKKKVTKRKFYRKKPKNTTIEKKDNIVPIKETKTPEKTIVKPKRPNKNNKNRKKEPKLGKLKIAMLGGLQEIGKNLCMMEYEDEIIIVDCGLGFPDEDMLGIDLVIPDVTYLEENKDKIKGMFITHGHEDHIGAIPYVLQRIKPKIYGTRLTLGILEHKLEEHVYSSKIDLNTVNAGDVIKAGKYFSVEFIHVNHSIPDACSLAIKTPLGTIFYTGDFKLDVSPIDGHMMDLTRIGELGKEGILLLMSESTNAERPGYTPSEKKVGGSLEEIFNKHKNKRLVVATFSSNVHRIQQIINISVKHHRKVAILGRSMSAVIGAATELGYMKVDEGTLINIDDIKRYRPQDITLITTGSQGEPMSALYRLAFDKIDKVHLTPDDTVVLSASAIPGNEKLVGKIINSLVQNGIEIINDTVAYVHVSGHACQEELKLMINLTNPKYFYPIHGESRHLEAHRQIAEFMGIPKNNIFVSELGKVLEISSKNAIFNGTIPTGSILVDGDSVGDVGKVVLRDRQQLANDGMLIVVATIDSYSKMIISGPEIYSRGFVYVKESEELMESLNKVAAQSLEKSTAKSNFDLVSLKNSLTRDLTNYLNKNGKRKPMILPIIMLTDFN